ncbi:MAG: hypothetical protein ACNA8W_13520 [Bradymonadaceae bacterium]
MSGVAFAVFAVAMMVGGGEAFAGEAEESEAQYDMNRAGVEAVLEEDYPRAIQLFKGSLALGELNITYLNLGRAQQRSGQCRDAAAAYQAVFEAPKVSSPSPREVEALARQYHSELERDCPGEIVVVCTPAEIELYLNTRGPVKCDGQPIEMRPGEVVVKGVLGKDEEEVVVIVKALKRENIELVMKSPGPDDLVVDDIVVPEERSGLMSRQTAPYWLVGGLAVFAGGVAFDTVPETGRNGRYDAMDFAPLPFYIIGGSAVVWAVREIWFQP